MVLVRLTSTTIVPVWHIGPQRSHSGDGLTDGLRNAGKVVTVWLEIEAFVVVFAGNRKKVFSKVLASFCRCWDATTEGEQDQWADSPKERVD